MCIISRKETKRIMRKFLSFWLAAFMLVSMMLPTAFAAGDAAASPKEGTEETTAEGEDEGAAKDAEASKDDKAAAILTTTATPVPTSTGPKTVCYPTAIDVRDEGAEIRKIYDLSPEADPAGISRTDFEHAGFSYTFVDLLKQELPEYEERTHTESVTLNSKKKDMESVLSLLPEQKEFVTDDGLSGILTLQLDTVQVETAGYGKSTKQVSVTRNYPNQVSQDTENIPKSIDDGGKTLTLSDIKWQTDNAANVNGYAMGDRYTAAATYTGTATSSYIKGYTVTAEYTGTVSRIALNKMRYVAIFEGIPIFTDMPDPNDTSDLMGSPNDSVEPPETVSPTEPVTPNNPTMLGEEPSEPESPDAPEQVTNPETPSQAPAFSFNWAYILVPLLIIALAGAGVGIALFIKHRAENGDDSE